MQQINFILGKLLLSRFAQLLSFELLYQSFSSTRSHYNAQIKDSVIASGILYVPCPMLYPRAARAFSWLKAATSAFTFKTLC